MKTIKMIELMDEYKIAKSNINRLVCKDEVTGDFIYCKEDGSIDESLGYEGWVCLTDTFMNQRWSFIN